MTYARSRLWLGMTTVGVLTVLAAIILASQVHASAIPVASDRDAEEFLAVLAAVSIWATALLPFDFIGGYALPKRFGKAAPAFPNFAWNWIRAVSIQCVLIAICLWFTLQAGQAGGLIASVSVVFTAQIALVISQKRLARIIANVDVQPYRTRSKPVAEPRVAAASHVDTGFTGAIVGLPGFEEVIMPQSWLHRLSREEFDAELKRRAGAIQSGSRARGVVLAITINTLSFAACTQLPSAGATTVSALISALLYFALLSFVWLLVLPRWSREGVFEADRFAYEANIPIHILEATAESIESLHDDEPRRSRRVESVFHPVPCVKRRVAELSLRIRSIRGYWNVARMTLFLSWACGGFLSRAVHCNIGRPELWVMPPVD
jgi:hypothetical protein